MANKGAPSGFVSEVEALRGVAAFSVVVEHCLLPLSEPLKPGLFEAYTGVQPILHWLLHAVFNGRASVLLFFVISGFALGRQVGCQPILAPRPWLAFAVRRLFRIMPAMWAAVLIAYLIAGWTGGHPEVDLRIFAKTLILQNTSLLAPLWTLNVEMGCSLVFPILLACGRRVGLFGNLVLALALSGLIYRVPWPPWDLRIEFLRYVMFFQIGLMAGSWGVQLWKRCSPVLRCSLLAAAAVGYGVVPQLWAFRAGYAIYADQRNWLPLEAPCCFVLVVYVIACSGCRETAWLRTRFAKFLGKISFSLYLVHCFVIDVFYKLYVDQTDWKFYHEWPLVMQLLLLVAVMCVSVPLSVVMFTYVERPFTRWGRIAAGWVVDWDKAKPVLREATQEASE